MLDLRDNGGGLLNEAVLISSIFVDEGTIVSTDGPQPAEARVRGDGRRDQRRHPGRRARQPRLGVGVGDRHRRAAGPRPRRGRRHAHVRQGRVPGDPRARRTAARSTSPSASTSRRTGATSAAAASSRAPASSPTSRPRTIRTRRTTRRSTRRSTRWRPRRDERGAAARRPVVAVLERRGRFLTAEPFFARGRRMNVDKPKSGQRAGAGDLVLSPRAARARATGGCVAPDRAPGRRARRARGADARPRAAAALRPAGRARGARRPRSAPRRPTTRAATCATLPTFTIDPPSARDFDDAISAERLDGGLIRVWVHIADVARPRPARARRSTARPTGARRASTSPARSSRCCPRRCRTRPARSSRTRTAAR